jgi:hypothetical protein
MTIEFRRLFAFAALLAVCGTTSLVAQIELAESHHRGQHRYKLVDLGTLGGPTSHQLAGLQLLNNRGTLIAFADLPDPDPYAPNCPGHIGRPRCRGVHGERPRADRRNIFYKLNSEPSVPRSLITPFFQLKA